MESGRYKTMKNYESISDKTDVGIPKISHKVEREGLGFTTRQRHQNRLDFYEEKKLVD